MSTQWSSAEPVTGATVDGEAYALETAIRSLLFLGSVTDPRSLQVSLGSSEAGHVCQRRKAYKLAGTPTVNFRDPLRSMVGKGVHLGFAEMMTRLDGGSGRFLVESRVEYRGIPGTVDLYDRMTGTVVDWKTTTLAKVKHLRHEGPAASYVTQTQLYGAGLKAAGEDVRTVALLFVPVDGSLDQMWAWRQPFDQRVADTAVDEVESLRGRDPATVPSTPDRLCGWCAHFRYGSTDLSVGCPGATP
jgi:hypothetical protein